MVVSLSLSILCAAIDLENVYHVTRRKWFYFVNKSKKLYISATKCCYEKLHIYLKNCKIGETNYDILNSNSDPTVGGGTPTPAESNIFLDYGLIKLIRSKSCLMHCHPYWPFFNSERIMLITCYFTLINISIWPIDKEQVQTKQSWGSPCIFDAQNSCAQWVSAWLTLLYQELINPNKRIVVNNFAQINEIGLKVIVLYQTQGTTYMCCVAFCLWVGILLMLCTLKKRKKKER